LSLNAGTNKIVLKNLKIEKNLQPLLLRSNHLISKCFCCFPVLFLSRGVQYVHFVMHKCIMVKLGETKNR